MDTKRNIIYALKGLAIISVVYAHCNNRVSYSETDALLENLRLSFGAVGVPFFFLISGYLFHNNKGFFEFWKGKIGIILPWIFWGTLIWAYQIIRKGFGYANLLEWLLGIGSYLWYMRNIVIFWLIFYFVRAKKIKILLFGIFVALRITIYDFGFLPIIESNVVLDEFFCQVPFFALGIVMQEINIKKIYDSCNRNICLAVAVISTVATMAINTFSMDDADKGFLLYIASLAVVSYELVCFFLKKKVGKWLIYLGENSYLIYLIHMPIAGIVSNLFSRNQYTLYMVLVYPMLAVVITLIGVFILNRLLGKNRWICKLCATRRR